MRREVVAAVIHQDGLILVAQRKNGVYAGLWEFPGGKVEEGEDPEAALAREIDEELGVVIEVRERLAEVAFSVAGTDYLLLAYLARHRSGEFSPVEHSRIHWLPPEELALLDLAPADIPVATLLASGDLEKEGPVRLSV